jgi:hypothetical protein
MLPELARQAHVFPRLSNHALLYIGVFCDAGCTVHFDQTSVRIMHQGTMVLEGTRAPHGLWTMQLPTNQANASYDASLKSTALHFLHASMFSPTTQTWVEAINRNHFMSWPMFNAFEVEILTKIRTDGNGTHGPTTQECPINEEDTCNTT